MKHDELKLVNESMLKLAEDIRTRKNKEYSSETDALANFKEAGKEYAAHPQVVLGIFMDKHLASIRTHIRCRQKDTQMPFTEPFRERIADAINYLLFLDALEFEYQDVTGSAIQKLTVSAGDVVHRNTELSPTEQASDNLLVNTGVYDV